MWPPSPPPRPPTKRSRLVGWGNLMRHWEGVCVCGGKGYESCASVSEGNGKDGVDVCSNGASVCPAYSCSLDNHTNQSTDGPNSKLLLHAYKHTCIRAYMHTCIHAYVHTCIRAYMHKCIHAQVHTCTSAYMHAWS